jgi:hypothetical protein
MQIKTNYLVTIHFGLSQWPVLLASLTLLEHTAHYFNFYTYSKIYLLLLLVSYYKSALFQNRSKYDRTVLSKILNFREINW